jgi:hypothetical protein
MPISAGIEDNKLFLEQKTHKKVNFTKEKNEQICPE